MGHLTFGGRYIFAKKIFLQSREEKKVTGDFIRGIGLNVLEHRPPVLTKKRRHTFGLVA